MTKDEEKTSGAVSPDHSAPDRSAPGPGLDTSVAHDARVYDYLLGGDSHFEADRALGDALQAAYPGIAESIRDTRAFLGRAVRFLAEDAGLSQFLDIGTGIPSAGSTHEVARDARPDSRIVYVDNDPVVGAQSRVLLAGQAPGSADYLDADLRDPVRLLTKAADTIDVGRPVGVLLLAVLHTIGDDDDPHRIVTTLMDALPSGSYLAITHWGPAPSSPDPDTAKVAGLTRQLTRQPFRVRDDAEVTRFFDGLSLVEPGVVRVQDWRPDPDEPATEEGRGITVWGAVGRKH